MPSCGVRKSVSASGLVWVNFIGPAQLGQVAFVFRNDQQRALSRAAMASDVPITGQ